MKTTCRARQRGFCFLELIGTMVIFVGITVAALAGVYWYQHHSQNQARLHATVCNMTAPSASATVISAAVSPSPRLQSVAVRSTSGLFAGEKVSIGQGATRETVVITPLNATTIQGVFAKNHATGAPVNAVQP